MSAEETNISQENSIVWQCSNSTCKNTEMGTIYESLVKYYNKSSNPVEAAEQDIEKNAGRLLDRVQEVTLTCDECMTWNNMGYLIDDTNPEFQEGVVASTQNMSGFANPYNYETNLIELENWHLGFFIGGKNPEKAKILAASLHNNSGMK